MEEAAKDWIEAALDLKQEIPSPSQSLSFGGKILLRLPKSLHRQLALIAEREGVSLNQFIVSALAEKVGVFTLYDKLTKKLDKKMYQVATNAAVNTFIANHITETSSDIWLNQPIATGEVPDAGKSIAFTHKEVVEALIRYIDLHEGLWGLYIEFGLAAANMGQGPEDILPTAIIPVKKIGLQRFKEANNLTVDAAEVNPESKGKKK